MVRNILILFLVFFLPSLSFSKVRRRVDLKLFDPDFEVLSGVFSDCRKNVIDLSGATKEQINNWFPVNRFAVFQAKSKKSETIDLINLGSKEIKDIIQKLRGKKGLRGSKISLLIRLEDLSYLSGIHQFIRKNKLEDLYVAGGQPESLVFDETFWSEFKTFALLTQSVRRYILIPDSVDPLIRTRMRHIFIENESKKVSELKKSVRSLLNHLELEKNRIRQDGLSYLRKKNNLSDSYQFSDEQIKAVTKNQKNLNETITSVNHLSEEIRRGLILLKKEIAIKKLELSYDPRYRDIISLYEDIPDLKLTLPVILLPNNYSSFVRKAESLEREQKELESLFSRLDSFYIGSESFNPSY